MSDWGFIAKIFYFLLVEFYGYKCKQITVTTGRRCDVL